MRLRIGALPGSEATTSPNTRLGTATTTSSASAIGASRDQRRVDSRRGRPSSRTAVLSPGGANDLDLLGVPRREHDLVTAVP